MAYTSEARREVILKANQYDQITREDYHGLPLEAHSATRLHLLCKVTGRVLDGICLTPDTHDLLHVVADQLSEETHANPQEVFDLTYDAVNLTNLSIAVEHLNHLNNEPRNLSNPERYDRKLKSLRGFISSLYSLPSFTYCLENGVTVEREKTFKKKQVNLAEV